MDETIIDLRQPDLDDDIESELWWSGREACFGFFNLGAGSFRAGEGPLPWRTRATVPAIGAGRSTPD